MSKQERIALLIEEAIQTRIKTNDLCEKIQDIVLEGQEDVSISDNLIEQFVSDKAFDGMDPDGEGSDLAEELLDFLCGEDWRTES